MHTTMPEATHTNGRSAPADRVAQRLDELRNELRTGEDRLRELEAERTRVREVVLRIEGAILALEELGADAAGRQEETP